MIFKKCILSTYIFFAYFMFLQPNNGFGCINRLTSFRKHKSPNSVKNQVTGYIRHIWKSHITYKRQFFEKSFSSNFGTLEKLYPAWSFFYFATMSSISRCYTLYRCTSRTTFLFINLLISDFLEIKLINTTLQNNKIHTYYQKYGTVIE